MGQNLDGDDTLSLNFTTHFDPDTRIPEPALSVEERRRNDEAGAIGASELNARGFFASIVRRTASAAPKAPGETNILVIEDDAGTAELIQRVLRKAGYLTRWAAARVEIVHELGRKPLADLILLDVLLANNLSGFDILNRIRRHPVLVDIPVILLTSLGERKDIVTGLSLGADGYLTKPAQPAVLVDAVRTVLQ